MISEVLIYFWDERDGPELCGWWFGPKAPGSVRSSLLRKAWCCSVSVGCKVTLLGKLWQTASGVESSTLGAAFGLLILEGLTARSLALVMKGNSTPEP